MLIALGILVFYVIPGALFLEVLRCAYLEFRRDRIPILLYHRLISRAEVDAGTTPDLEPIYAVYDDVFSEQMQRLHEKGYATLSLDQLMEIRAGSQPLPRRSVLITFDDGYRSVARLAFPVLRRLGQQATVFVAPEPDDHTRSLVAGFDDFLSADQMLELDRHAIAIESHTLTHCILNELDEPTARYELEESKRRLADLLGRPVRHLAVPRSGQSREVRRLAVEAGYQTICCNNKGSSNGWSSLHALPRIVIERESTLR